MTVKNIKTPKTLRLMDVEKIPELIETWLTFDKPYTFDKMIEEQIYSVFGGNTHLIAVESAEWTANWSGRVNDYDSEITVWVTAVIETDMNKFKRVSFDLFDSLVMPYDGDCSKYIHE